MLCIVDIQAIKFSYIQCGSGIFALKEMERERERGSWTKKSANNEILSALYTASVAVAFG